jgi:hypothetical protein
LPPKQASAFLKGEYARHFGQPINFVALFVIGEMYVLQHVYHRSLVTRRRRYCFRAWCDLLEPIRPAVVRHGSDRCCGADARLSHMLDAWPIRHDCPEQGKACQAGALWVNRATQSQSVATTRILSLSKRPIFAFGNRAGDVVADRDAWPRTSEFLRSLNGGTYLAGAPSYEPVLHRSAD